MRLRSIGFSMALGLAACTGQVVPLGHGIATTQGALGEPTLSNGTCDQGLSACAGVCVDTTKDMKNCGACGVACGTDELCGGGRCALPTQPDNECSLADIGRLCSGDSTCIPATCCDDPAGCAATSDAGIDVDSGSSGSSSSSSGGSTGSGTSRACAICEFIGGTYCPESDLGKACPGGGVCGDSGGGGSMMVTEVDGGMTTATFGFSTCGTSDADSGTSSSSSGGGTPGSTSSGSGGSSGTGAPSSTSSGSGG